MKKIISLALVGIMALSMVPTALATTDYTNGTKVEYVGQGDAQYTITVPALLAPGGEGDVTLQGTWASDATVKVTADKTVTLTNSINSADQKVLDVTFAGIEKAGDNTQTVQAVEAVSVSDISNALFGTWSGKFNYNVEYVEPETIELIHFEIDGYPYAAAKDMTWGEFLNSEYCPAGWHSYLAGEASGNPYYYVRNDMNQILKVDDFYDVITVDKILDDGVYNFVN